MKRAILCLILALMMVSCLLPAVVLAADDDGDGYDDYEIGKLRDFLNQTSATGISNGLQLTAAYNPSDPATWATLFAWSGKHVTVISLDSCWLAGSLDLSNFTSLTNLSFNTNEVASLNVSGCTALETLTCNNNKIETMDLSHDYTALELFECDNNLLTTLPLTNCPSLRRLVCSTNSLSKLDISGMAALEELYCYDNQISSLNITGVPVLKYLYCGNNKLTSLDTTASPHLEALEALGNPITSFKATLYNGASSVKLTAHGGGTIILTLIGATQVAMGLPSTGESLINYTDAGVDLGAVDYILLWANTNYDITANFTPLTVTFDSNGGSAVTPVDATYYEQIATPVPTLTNYALEGWYEDAALTQKAAFPYTVTKDITLYAKWQIAPTLSSSDDDGKIVAGGTVTLIPNFEGGTWSFDNTMLSRSGNTFTALMPGSTRVTYTVEGQSTYYDLVVNALLTLSSSDDDAIIYTKGRVILTPNIEGGTWSWDKAFFSATFNSPATFTALKEGTTTITYTADGQTASYAVTIMKSVLPVTGQDFIFVSVLSLAAVILVGLARVFVRRVKAGNIQS